MSYQYTYLLMSLLFLFVWLVLFLLRKDTRKHMLIISIIFATAGVLADSVYTQDWWKPITLTNTPIGFESLLTGFGIGGISSVIYMDTFKRKLIKKELNKQEKRLANGEFILLQIFLMTIFLGSFYILHLNSFLSTILALAIPTLYVYLRRLDLLLASFATGLLLLGVSLLLYSFLSVLTPGWIDKFFYFKNVPHIILFNMPIDDLAWYFLAGLYIGTLYPYWKKSKYEKL